MNPPDATPEPVTVIKQTVSGKKQKAELIGVQLIAGEIIAIGRGLEDTPRFLPYLKSPAITSRKNQLVLKGRLKGRPFVGFVRKLIVDSGPDWTILQGERVQLSRGSPDAIAPKVPSRATSSGHPGAALSQVMSTSHLPKLYRGSLQRG